MTDSDMIWVPSNIICGENNERGGALIVNNSLNALRKLKDGRPEEIHCPYRWGDWTSQMHYLVERARPEKDKTYYWAYLGASEKDIRSQKRLKSCCCYGVCEDIVPGFLEVERFKIALWIKRKNGFKIASREMGPGRWFEVMRYRPKSLDETDFDAAILPFFGSADKDEGMLSHYTEEQLFAYYQWVWCPPLADALHCRYFNEHAKLMEARTKFEGLKKKLGL